MASGASADTSFTRSLVISDDKTQELRLLPDVYSVRVSKPGFLEKEQTVTVSQAGASVQVELQTRPVEVKFEWSPPGAKVLVDGNRPPALDLPVRCVVGGDARCLAQAHDQHARRRQSAKLMQQGGGTQASGDVAALHQPLQGAAAGGVEFGCSAGQHALFEHADNDQ